KGTQTAASNGSADGAKYTVEDGCLAMIRTTRDGDSTTVPLCNFNAQIIEEVVRDDGVEQSRRFVIEGQLANGEKLPAVEVRVEGWGAMNWPAGGWGRAVVNAGFGNRDHLRAAVHLRALDAPRRVVYCHTGWVKAEGTWLYLHADGAIGPNGLVDSVSV